jgi:hypothetical protein
MALTVPDMSPEMIDGVLSQSQPKAGGRREHSQLHAALPVGVRVLAPDRLDARSWASSSSSAFRSQRSL